MIFNIINGWSSCRSNFRRWRRLIHPHFNLGSNSIDFILPPDFHIDYQTPTTKKWRYYQSTTKTPTIQGFLDFCDFWYNDLHKEKPIYNFPTIEL
jgi:hypothetical protein